MTKYTSAKKRFFNSFITSEKNAPPSVLQVYQIHNNNHFDLSI